MNYEPKDGTSVHNPAEHPALTELRELAESGTLRVGNEENWRMQEINDAAASRAAVLMLFGVLDDAPAQLDAQEVRANTVSADLDVLIVVRAATLRKHAGQPAFPGGKIDPEDFEKAQAQDIPVTHVAALREAVEETGVDLAGVDILGNFEEVGLPVSNFMVTPVLGWWNKPSAVLAQDANESSLVIRVPVADLLDPKNRHMAQIKSGRVTHRSPAFTVRQEGEEFVIWGFTGILLNRLFDALGWTQPWDTKLRRPAPGY